MSARRRITIGMVLAALAFVLCAPGFVVVVGTIPALTALVLLAAGMGLLLSGAPTLIAAAVHAHRIAALVAGPMVVAMLGMVSSVISWANIPGEAGSFLYYAWAALAGCALGYTLLAWWGVFRAADAPEWQRHVTHSGEGL